MPTPEQVRATVDAYVDAYARNDKEAFLALWASDGVLGTTTLRPGTWA